MDALSRGTEAAAFLRHDYASPSFTHAVDSTVTTSFNLNWPDERGGTAPDRLLPRLPLRPPDPGPGRRVPRRSDLTPRSANAGPEDPADGLSQTALCTVGTDPAIGHGRSVAPVPAAWPAAATL